MASSLNIDDIEDVIAEMNRVADQPKCACKMGMGLLDESIRQFMWWRCKVCAGLISEVRVVEGTAIVVTGTVQ